MNCLYDPKCLESISITEIRDAFRSGQITSKQWLIDQIHPLLSLNDKIIILGSWFGFLGRCLSSLGYVNITEVDINLNNEFLAKKLNANNPAYIRITTDANNLDLSNYDCIINTSSEHMQSIWFDNIPKNKLVAIQNNNLSVAGHINICQNLNELQDKFPLNAVFNDQLDMNTYKRFMLIGYK